MVEPINEKSIKYIKPAHCKKKNGKKRQEMLKLAIFIDSQEMSILNSLENKFKTIAIGFITDLIK